MEQVRTTWLTVYSSMLIIEGRVAYSFYYRHDTDHKSYTGVFKAQIRDTVHAEACALGAALKDAREALKGVKINGITIYSDCTRTRSMLEQYRTQGSIPVSDINLSYVVPLNQLLNSLRAGRMNVRAMKKNRFTENEWMIPAMKEKIMKVKEKESFGSVRGKR